MIKVKLPRELANQNKITKIKMCQKYTDENKEIIMYHALCSFCFILESQRTWGIRSWSQGILEPPLFPLLPATLSRLFTTFLPARLQSPVLVVLMVILSCFEASCSSPNLNYLSIQLSTKFVLIGHGCFIFPFRPDTHVLCMKNFSTTKFLGLVRPLNLRLVTLYHLYGWRCYMNLCSNFTVKGIKIYWKN